jgi:hypothetical protein
MEITFVPETDEERERVGLSGYKVTRGYKETAARIDASGFAQIIRRGSEFAEFDVHRAFLHDGMRHFRALRYVAAFYQFYFVLEDLYSDGKTSEKGVTRAFAHSNELTSILAWSLQTFTKENDRHSRILARFMSAERCDLSVDGLRTFLFRIRGHLHHYSSRSPKPRGTPFNQKDFETVALLGMLVARQAIDRRIAAR